MGKRPANNAVASQSVADKKNNAAAADKKKPEKRRPSKDKTEGVQGPVPVRKVPSFRGKNQLGLYAAGGMARAPSPGNLPLPPASWTKAGRDAAASSHDAIMPPPLPVLRRQESVVQELQGNLLYLTLSPQYPDLAGKITGMLLELGADEVKDILGSALKRDQAVQEALGVLREAGDERALAMGKVRPPLPAVPPGLGLSVDIGAAHDAMAAAEVATGLTPGLGGLMRMSPRVSSNPFQTANLLRGAAAK